MTKNNMTKINKVVILNLFQNLLIETLKQVQGDEGYGDTHD
jgi:hypothetical protein